MPNPSYEIKINEENKKYISEYMKNNEELIQKELLGILCSLKRETCGKKFKENSSLEFFINLEDIKDLYTSLLEHHIGRKIATFEIDYQQKCILRFGRTPDEEKNWKKYRIVELEKQLEELRKEV